MVKSNLTNLLRLILICLSIFITGCSTLQVEQERGSSFAFSKPLNTSLGKLSATASVHYPEESGFLLLNTGKDALLKRVVLLDFAEQAIDLQYYIWNSDKSGRLLAHKLLLAADRGVHVRLLLDDFSIAGRDGLLFLMNSHPNIDIRIYNPNAARKGMVRKLLGFIGDFGRLNQRMHNKSFIVDNSVAIVGGRNIGDEYFDLNHELNFRDRDLLAAGPVVAEVSQSFDAYWNNDRAFSITHFFKAPALGSEVQAFRKKVEEKVLQDDLAILSSNIDLNLWFSDMIWAPAEIVYDQIRPINDNDHNVRKSVANALRKMAKNASVEVLIESAYLVPGDEGVTLLKELTDRGVKVTALTNSLASNDLTTNHSAYVRRRKELLRNGAELFELRPDAQSCQHLVVIPYSCDNDTLFGLHAKSIVFDRKAVFVGSFNLNQRSIYLNSELALIIYSPELAEIIAEDIEQNLLAENSWHVVLDKKGNLQWKGIKEAASIEYSHEPETGFWRRFNSGFFSLFPVEKYL
ncbi:MAG: phospholipase D family protein [Piscirickettsiaceae bacterium]|nr:phospholipase D family protein [Piscirickettsiaceae bacterium]